MVRETKTDRERSQVEDFLRDFIAYDNLESVQRDPPDIRVWNIGSVILNLEVTEYHVDQGEVASNSRWTERLWPKIDDLRKQDPSLKDILGFLVFSDHKLPGLTKPENEGLAAELVQLARQVGSNLGDLEELKISFSPRSFALSHPVIQPGWNWFPSEDWPLCAKHISAVTFTRFPQGWHRWTCPQVDAAWKSMTTAKFRSIFHEKEAKVRKAWNDTTRFAPGVPTWLLIVSDLYNDRTNHLFPTSQADREELFASINECGYDFLNSPFAQVWLYADFDHRRLRLFPSPI